MGFRNPITTATAVDTGRGLASPGVRLYQDTSVPAVPTGVAEWRTGQMARNATAKLSGGGSGGSAFTIDGGAALANNDAPTIGLNVEGLAAGGYGPVLRLNGRPSEGGRIVADTALDPLVSRARLTLPFNGTGTFQPYGAFGTENGLYGGGGYPTAVKLASGLVVVTGMVTAVNLSFGINATVATLPAGCTPTQLRRYVLQGWGTGGWIAEVSPTGAITYAGGLSGSTPAAGSFLSFAGISFDTFA